jgi:UDP-perosamine 4-acetyltransferase
MKPSVVLIGGGGHAKVIIEIMEASGGFDIAGCVTANTRDASVLDAPILGDDSCLPGLYASGIRHAFVATGANELRLRLSSMAAEIGFKLVSAVSPQATVSPRARLKDGCAIMPGAVINSCATIGAGCIVNTGATVDHDCTIGDWVHLAPGTSLAGHVSICEGAFLGVGTRVIPDITIGAWAIVGAGTVVVRNLPANVTAVGVPARIISSREHP